MSSGILPRFFCSPSAPIVLLPPSRCAGEDAISHQRSGVAGNCRSVAGSGGQVVGTHGHTSGGGEQVAGCDEQAAGSGDHAAGIRRYASGSGDHAASIRGRVAAIHDFEDFFKKYGKTFGGVRNSCYLCNRLRKVRAFSSAGLEHLPYKQRVGGSNPSTPTPS